MKERLTSSAVGLALLAVILYFYETQVLNITLAVLSVIGLSELLAVFMRGERGLKLLLCMLCATFPFIPVRGIYGHFAAILIGCAVLVCFTLIWGHGKLRAEVIIFAYVMAVAVPASLCTAIWVRDLYGERLGFFYMGTALCAAWMADAGGYFFGMLFGKHKLIPQISPKKTVEGAVGSFLFGAAGVMLLALILSNMSPALFGVSVQVNYARLLTLSPILTVIGIAGDLAASVLKRQNNIKDFGSIMPGHGGVIDRFDSVLYVMPCVYLLSVYMPFYA